jgi:hypothetical protein
MRHRLICLFCLGLALAAVCAAEPGNPVLVRIPAPALTEARGTVPGEALRGILADGVLAAVDAATLARLQAAGLAGEILDGFDPDRPLYLVRVRSDADAAALAPLGATARLAEDAVLFQCPDDRPARDVVPARLALRALLPEGWPAASPPAEAPPERLAQAPTAADPLIAQIADEVSTAQLQASIQTLQDFGTRKANNENNGCQLAGDFIFNTFTTSGVGAEFDPFSFLSYTTRNVVATLPGARHPEKVIIICGHYDSTSHTAGEAPGADDNASGTAAVLEAARIFAGRSFEYTVKFIAFSAEEYGLYGSAHYAAAAQSTGEQIVGVVNMDMIGFLDPDHPEDLDLIGKAGSEWLWQTFLDIGPLYVNMAYEAGNTGETWSDHASFWNRGFSAICAIEDRADTNPYYHSRYDTIDTLNFDFLTRAATACIAVTAYLAGPLAEPGDLNRDAAVDTLDLALLAHYLSGDETALPAGGGSADLTGDGAVSAADLVLLHHRILN